jgi:hypothetical protein
VPDWSRTERTAVEVAGLRRYYETHRGRLECLVVGLPSAPPPEQRAILRGLGPHLRNVRPLEFEADGIPCGTLTGAAHVWVCGVADDVVALAIRAGERGVRILADRHPVLEEIAGERLCDCVWTDGCDAVGLAEALRRMEVDAVTGGSAAAGARVATLGTGDDGQVAAGYWEAIRQCL